MNQKLATEVNQYLKAAFPLLEGLWYFSWHPQMGDMIELHLCDASDFISMVGDEYSTGDHVMIKGALQRVLEYTSVWKALRRITKKIPELRNQLQQTKPISLYGVEYKYLGIFEHTHDYLSEIITLQHDVLGKWNLTSNDASYFRKLDAILDRIA